MPATVASYLDVAKEVWTDDEMVKQFYDENPWLDRLEKQQRTIIGKQAQVPIHRGRAGGTTVLDAAGGTINPPSNEIVDQAQFTLAYNYFPVGVEFGVLNQVTGGAQHIAEGLEHTMSSGIQNLRNQVTRQFLTGDGIVAACDTGGASTTVELASLAQIGAGQVSGADATGLGWLSVGDVVEIGTASDTDTLVDGGTNGTITAVNDDPDNPSITIGASISTTLGTHFVALSGSRGAAGTSVVESAGLKTIAGTLNNVVGGVDANVDKYWNPSLVDTTSSLPDLPLLLKMGRRVARKTGKNNVFLLTSLLQLDNIYQFLQTQVRFSGDRELGAGASETVRWRGMEIHAFPQVPENVLYFLDMDSLEIVLGKYTKPTWLSDVGGVGMVRSPNKTLFEDTVAYPLGLATKRRNSFTAAVNLKE